MVFMNYHRLERGIPSRMHFTDYYLVQREITVPETGGTKVVWSHIFQLDELNGEDSTKTFSVLSQKLFAILEPFVKNKTFKQYDFVITEMGSQYHKDWDVQVIKRPENP